MVARCRLSFALGGSYGITHRWVPGSIRCWAWTLGLRCKRMGARCFHIVIRVSRPQREFPIHRPRAPTPARRVLYPATILRLFLCFHRQVHSQNVRLPVCFGVELTAPVFHSRPARKTVTLTAAPGMLVRSPARDLALRPRQHPLPHRLRPPVLEAVTRGGCCGVRMLIMELAPA